MAATDMKLAGLEIGCKCSYLGHEGWTLRRISNAEPQYLAEKRNASGKQVQRSAWFYEGDLIRDYDDAQAARIQRLTILDEHYPSDAQPEHTDTIERYCGVVKTLNFETNVVGWWWYFDDDLDEVFSLMAEVTDCPEAVFDLDTGERIELHVVMTITKSEDQGAMVNVLRPEEN